MNVTMKMPATLAGTIVNPLPVREVYLHPGQMYVSNEPAQISMILGSCAGVCIYDRRRSIGGATHYMLPKWDGSGKPSPRYGDVAIEAMFNQFQIYGSKPSDLEARVFGGACMFEVFRGGDGADDHIGSRNVSLAMEFLCEHGIGIVAKDTGGENGRKLKMQSDTGLVLVSLIRNS
jgi:chemotaxis protein CheD